jgi:hypothetical protein
MFASPASFVCSTNRRDSRHDHVKIALKSSGEELIQFVLCFLVYVVSHNFCFKLHQCENQTTSQGVNESWENCAILGNSRRFRLQINQSGTMEKKANVSGGHIQDIELRLSASSYRLH